MSPWQRGESAHHSQHQLPSKISVLVLVTLIEALASHLNRVHLVVGIAIVVCSEASRSLVGGLCKQTQSNVCERNMRGQHMWDLEKFAWQVVYLMFRMDDVGRTVDSGWKISNFLPHCSIG